VKAGLHILHHFVAIGNFERHVQSFAVWQQATIEIMFAISLTIACSHYIYNGVILHVHPVRGESHNQRNTTGEVATLLEKTKKLQHHSSTNASKKVNERRKGKKKMHTRRKDILILSHNLSV